MISDEELASMEEEALKQNIPVMQKEGIDFICQTLNDHHMTSLLEIGSAIGYSALSFVSHVDNLIVESIEIDEGRYNEAMINVEKYQYEDRIYLHLGDALTFEGLVLNEYDCLFIDAAKAQYQKFFERYVPYLKEDGIVVVDNLDFHGMIYDIEHIKNRNTRQLVRKIKRFKDWIFAQEEYDTTYYPIGDGIVVIKRKGLS